MTTSSIRRGRSYRASRAGRCLVVLRHPVIHAVTTTNGGNGRAPTLGRRFRVGGIVGGIRAPPTGLHSLGQLTKPARDQHCHCKDARRKGDECAREDNAEGEEGGQDILKATERVPSRVVSVSVSSTVTAL